MITNENEFYKDRNERLERLENIQSKLKTQYRRKKKKIEKEFKISNY